MQSFFANQSCDPFSSRSTLCQLGNYVSYAVNVTSTTDVQAAVLFAQLMNIRLVVRNTGHEYVGAFLSRISLHGLTPPLVSLAARLGPVRWPSGRTTWTVSNSFRGLTLTSGALL